MRIRLQRLSTAVPWPRGITLIGKTAYLLARGVPRQPGGPHPFVFDRAGTIFTVDTRIWEWVPRQKKHFKPVSKKVRANAKAFAPPDQNVFKLWGRDEKGKQVRVPWEDIDTDRPYATLVWDTKSRNFFICGFSGIDNAPRSNEFNFRKNGNDAILRFDQRDRSWREVERHDANRIKKSVRKNPKTTWLDNIHYEPKKGSTKPPQGLLNGPDGLHVFGAYLLAVAKDNDVVARYSLDRIRKNPKAQCPQSAIIFKGKKTKKIKTVNSKVVDFGGYSSLAVHAGKLYLGGRDHNRIVRMPITKDAEVDVTAIELVADLGKNSALIDIAFDSTGWLFASTAGLGAIWKIPIPSGRCSIYRAKDHQPWFKLGSFRVNGKCTNIAFDREDRLYLCTNNDDIGGDEPRTAGVVYRVIED